MSSKRQKLPAKRSRPSEAPTPAFDASRFANLSAAERFGTICKNRSFIKEKGFHHPDDFFRKTIEAKGWRALCQPPRPAAMSVVREFYANLDSHVLKKVRVRGVLVNFSAESINIYYGLEHIPPGPFDQLREHPDYPEVIRVLTKGRGEWRINSAGHAVNFKAKHLAYIPKVWHHFITSRLIPTTNVCEVTAQRSLLNFAIIQDIPFDVGQVIEDAILHNREAKMNLGHPFLIFGLCKQAGVPLDDNEAWLHPIKAISVKRDTPGVPQPEGVYDSGHEPSDEDELPDYRASWVTPRRTLASPRLDLHHHHRIDHRHHHPSSLRRLPLLVLPQILRTRCSPSLSVLTHSGTRPRSTESSLLRIWRRCVLTCRQFWPIRPSSYSSSRLCRPSLLSSWRSTSHLHLHRSEVQGSSLTLYIFILPVGTLDIFLGGGGGGIFCSGTLFLGFVYRCFGFVVLISVVYSIFSCSAYLFCFVFSITCSCR